MEKDRSIFANKEIESISLIDIEGGVVIGKKVLLKFDENAWVDKESGCLLSSAEFTGAGSSDNYLDFLKDEFVCILPSSFLTRTRKQFYLGNIQDIDLKECRLRINGKIVSVGITEDSTITFQSLSSLENSLKNLLAVFTISFEEVSNLQFGRTIIEIKGKK